MQPEITTECPDIFKLEVGNTGTYKWVLSEGGRYYRVGDLKKVDGVWKFVEGSGLAKNPKLTELLYPDLPKDTKFPEVKLEIIDGSE